MTEMFDTKTDTIWSESRLMGIGGVVCLARKQGGRQVGADPIHQTLDVEQLLAYASALAVKQDLPYSWAEAEVLIREDPRYFKIALGKAERSEYKRANGHRQVNSLWIALNLVQAKRLTCWCYYCGKTLCEDEFYSGKVHLEHFNPRSSGGTHEPANIIHSCSKCDELKGALSAEQRLGLWNGTIDVNVLFPKWSKQARQRLLEFVDLDAPHVVGLHQYAIKHSVALRSARAFWDQRKEAFRKRWAW